MELKDEEHKLFKRSEFLRISAFTAGACIFFPTFSAYSAMQTIPERGDSLDSLAADLGDKTGSPFLLRGTRQTRRVALTFDDGPTPGVTDPILDVLKKHQVKATFFMIGARVEENPDLARRIRDEGHELANHTYTHPDLSRMSNDQVTTELSRASDAIKTATGVKPVWFRPPYGAFKTSQTHLATAQNMAVVIWSVDPRDWARPGAEAIKQRVCRNTVGGDIVLCHDLYRQTADAAPFLIETLIKRGWELVTLSKLMES